MELKKIITLLRLAIGSSVGRKVHTIEVEVTELVVRLLECLISSFDKLHMVEYDTVFAKSYMTESKIRVFQLSYMPFSSIRGQFSEPATITVAVIIAIDELIVSILEKEKLSGSNFLDSYRNLRIFLKAEKKLIYLEQPIPPTHTPAPPATEVPPDVFAVYTRWVDAQQEIACLLLASMTLELQKNLEDFNAYDMLKELKTMFSQQAD
ncbi:hypothetical protein Tco_1077590 [Tanacetum coccineum]